MNLSAIHDPRRDDNGSPVRDEEPRSIELGVTRPTLTVQETAELLGISRWLVQQAVRRGELPVVRIGRRILIPRARLEAMLVGASCTCDDTDNPHALRDAARNCPCSRLRSG